MPHRAKRTAERRVTPSQPPDQSPDQSTAESSGRVCVDAPAKINLFLHVTGRRDDGYHLLESFVVFAEFGDRITVAPSDALSLSIEGPFATELPAGGGDNLVLRAANALRDTFTVDAGARIVLEKNLPVSSGIGGGSADAAAVLRALSVLWKLGVADSRLAEIGIAIGADVPVCLKARPAVMSGVGEIVEDAAAPPPVGVVLVNAREGVSTPAVFAARTAPFSDSTGWETPETFEAFITCLAERKNDLFEPARSVSPVIDEVLAAIKTDGQCALARLSGSGGTCFGVYPDAGTADAAARRIRSAHPGWWCVATTFRDTQPPVTAV